MKAYVTSIGEPTTKICCDQLERFGFEVILLDGKEPWIEKFKKFIDMAEENCLRIDADVIPNDRIRYIYKDLNENEDLLMAQWKTYDFYRNGVGITSPVYYTKEAIDIIRNNWKDVDRSRPEASSWRLKQINPRTYTFLEVIGMHGFFQDDGHLERHLENKIERKQMGEYDFNLAKQILKL